MATISSLRGFLSTLSTEMELASWTEKKKLKKVEIQNYGGKCVVGTPWEGASNAHFARPREPNRARH